MFEKHVVDDESKLVDQIGDGSLETGGEEGQDEFKQIFGGDTTNTETNEQNSFEKIFGLDQIKEREGEGGKGNNNGGTTGDDSDKGANDIFKQ